MKATLGLALPRPSPRLPQMAALAGRYEARPLTPATPSTLQRDNLTLTMISGDVNTGCLHSPCPRLCIFFSLLVYFVPDTLSVVQ